ncbi:MAG TPA: hypothetical protein VK812_01500 [Candidatus Binatus sp.]|nr:hypothetical protein [Candidatus Binatus sp.]
MRRFVFVLLLAILSSTFAFASPASAHSRLTPVKAAQHRRDSRVERHRAHRAVKRHTSRRHRRMV